jgi:hypothetical protein
VLQVFVSEANKHQWHKKHVMLLQVATAERVLWVDVSFIHIYTEEIQTKIDKIDKQPESKFKIIVK